MRQFSSFKVQFVLAVVVTIIFGVILHEWLVHAFELKDPILKKDGIEYAITGVAESKDDPRWKDFPLKLVFATVRGELYSDVMVRIFAADRKKKIFKIKVDAPWLVVRLNPGTYYIEVDGPTKKSATVNVPSRGQAEYTFKW